MKQLYLVANWKSNKTVEEAKEWVSVISHNFSDVKIPSHVSVILCAPFTVSAILQQEASTLALPMHLGVQTISSYPNGAYTGEISAQMVKGLADYVLIGHSERRRYFHESDAELLEKAKQAAGNGLNIIYCVENADQPVPTEAVAVLYEPQAAIGSGKSEDPAISNTMCKTISEKHSNVPVLYGGSVTEETVKGFIEQPYISGVGVGGASLDPVRFFHLIEAFSSYAG